MTPKHVHALVASELKELDRRIKTVLNSKIRVVNDICDYIISNGGKRIRPILCLLSAKAIQSSPETALELAMIVEIIHTATLLHDDVVDDSGMRRGKKTANIVWDSPTAVLTGDYLYSKAFVMMSHLEHPTAMQRLSECTNVLAEGEVMQLHASFNAKLTEAEYFDVIYHKTASLFEASCYLPAVVGNADATMIEALQLYGRHIGTAFQLIDDIIDYTSSSKLLGKNNCDDLAEGKVTLPVIYALANSSDAERQEICQTLQNPGTTDLKHIRSLIINSGAIEYARCHAKRESELAKSALAPIPDSQCKDGLLAICDLALERKK